MMTDYPDSRVLQTDTRHPQSHSPRSGKPGTAGLVTAGAMTALLSGDVRLAVRATRLLISDSNGDGAYPTRRVRRVWRKPR
jgi:hypothetical protein